MRFSVRSQLIRIAALTGALIFSLAAFASLEIVNFVIIQVYIWLPLQLLCVHRVTSGEKQICLVWARGLHAAVAPGGSSANDCVLLVLRPGVLVVLHLFCLPKRELSVEDSFDAALASRELPKMVAMFALVFALAAVMVIPAY